MKTLRTLLVIAVAIFGFTATSFAQSTATATATATLLVPISIQKTQDMDFGTAAATATAGTLGLSDADVVTPSAGIQKISGVPKSAAFTVTGEGASTYVITLPSAPYTLTNTIGTGHETMTVDGFQTTTVPKLTAGTQNFKVGATLHIAAGQAAGVYTNVVPFSVIVNYN
jgi:hypothetical protein